jgi:DNA-binding GntR family transcriptional regulator
VVGDWYLDEVIAGVADVRRELEVEAVLADDFVAPILGIDPGRPLLFFERRLARPDGTVFEYGFSYCRSEALSFVVQQFGSGEGRDLTP